MRTTMQFTLTLLLTAAASTADGQTLEGFASLPATTFAAGPTSGQFITPANGIVPPFLDQQPVQGVSSVLRASNGDFFVMSDNGFGAQANSADYVLRVYRISPEFKTRHGGSGAIDVEGSLRSAIRGIASTFRSSPSRPITPTASGPRSRSPRTSRLAAC